MEPCAPVVGGYTYNREEMSTNEHGKTDTQNISGRQKENRSGAAGTLGKNQGCKEGVVRYFESAGEPPALNSVFDWLTGKLAQCLNQPAALLVTFSIGKHLLDRNDDGFRAALLDDLAILFR